MNNEKSYKEYIKSLRGIASHDYKQAKKLVKNGIIFPESIGDNSTNLRSSGSIVKKLGGKNE